MRVVVPIADLRVQARQALAFARAIAPDDQHVVAVHVTDDSSEADELRGQWEHLGARRSAGDHRVAVSAR